MAARRSCPLRRFAESRRNGWAPHVSAVSEALTYHFSRLERMLRNALDRAVDSGELARLKALLEARDQEERGAPDDS